MKKFLEILWIVVCLGLPTVMIYQLFQQEKKCEAYGKAHGFATELQFGVGCVKSTEIKPLY